MTAQLAHTHVRIVNADSDDALVDLWLHGKAPGTQAGYRYDVRSLLDLGPLGALTLDALQGWMDTLAARASRYTRAT